MWLTHLLRRRDVRAAQRPQRLHEALMQLGRPPQPRLGALRRQAVLARQLLRLLLGLRLVCLLIRLLLIWRDVGLVFHLTIEMRLLCCVHCIAHPVWRRVIQRPIVLQTRHAARSLCCHVSSIDVVQFTTPL